jgi:hypothetical protein
MTDGELWRSRATRSIDTVRIVAVKVVENMPATHVNRSHLG